MVKENGRQLDAEIASLLSKGLQVEIEEGSGISV
jgi:hypothetical protein